MILTPSKDKAYEITVTSECFLKCPLEFHIFENHDLHSQTHLCTRLLLRKQH